MHVACVHPVRIVLLLAAAALLAGCEEIDDYAPEVFISRESVSWSAEVFDYTNVDNIYWNTYHHQVFVEFEAVDFEGTIKLEVFDDDGVLIYYRRFEGTGGNVTSLDETLPGDDGEWDVRIRSDDVTGRFLIQLY